MRDAGTHTSSHESPRWYARDVARLTTHGPQPDQCDSARFEPSLADRVHAQGLHFGGGAADDALRTASCRPWTATGRLARDLPVVVRRRPARPHTSGSNGRLGTCRSARAPRLPGYRDL